MPRLSMSRREKTLRAHGITIRRATQGEQTTTPAGEHLRWVIECGDAHHDHSAYLTKEAALRAAEMWLP
jgi:hypothetical protein